VKKNLILFLLLICIRSYSIGISGLITESQFNTMFPNRNAYATNTEFATNPANKALFSYTNLVNAAATFPLFCNEGDIDVRKRELAAFLANTSHETTGGWGGYVPGAADYVGRYTWGYCFPREFGYNPTMSGQYCDAGSTDYPPVSGQSYYGRGPVQISWNYNYGAFSLDVLGDKNILLNNPEKVLEDGTVFFQSAVWFWMTPQTGGWGMTYLKPSCHDVMVNAWTPTDPQKTNDKLTPGFPVTINVINGGLESGPTRSNQHSPDDRLGFYLRYCEILGVEAIDPAWGYSSTYSFSTWDINSEIHKQLNSYYPDNFTLQTRSQGSCSITGYVKDAVGNGIARCHIALMNGTTYYEQAITDNTGKYTIDKIPNATYSVVALKGSLTFAPASLSVTITAANTVPDIIATDPNSTIVSGVVTNSSSTGVQNVTVNLTGTTNYTTTTNATGNYTLNPVAGTYTLTFTKANYTFTANNSSITIAAGNTLTQNSTATYSGSYFTLSGNIKKADGITAFNEVTVALTGGKSATATTDASGNYSFSNLEQNLAYTVTPSISGSIFTDQTVSNLTGNTAVNFTAQAPTCVSGKILLNGSPLTGVALKISNRADSALTDAGGNYITPNLTDGSNYMITPVKNGYVFEPAYKYYSSINQAETLDFTAKAVTGSPKKKIIYYYPDWATYGRNFQVKDIDTRYITNLLFAFVMPFYVDGTKSVDDDVPYRSGKNGKVMSVENITVGGVAKSVGLAIVDDFADIQKFPTGGIDVETGTGTGGTYVSTCAEWLAAPYKAKGALGQMVQLRKKVKNETGRDIQIQISIGGWTLAQAFPSIADNQIASDAFGRACKTFLDKSTYDGVDIDWEFPVAGGTDGTESIDGSAVPAQPHTSNDPTNFTRLMKSIRTAIGPTKLLTMASAQNPANVLDKYVFPGTMAKFGVTDNCLNYLDYIQTMSYDYGGYWCGVATHECPLYNSKDASDENRNMSASMLIDTLLSKNGGNIPANKIVMGLPFYGKIFGGIVDGGTHGLYQTNPKPGAMLGSWDTGTTPANEASTSIDYGDLKDGKAATKHQYLNLPTTGFTEYWDDVVKCPYLYNPTSKVFVTYDDANSLSEKVKFLNSRYLLGGMVWEVTQDASNGTLMKAVYNNIQQAKLKIDGTIVDNTGAGINGVTVTLSGGVASTATTGEDGKFSFIDLEPGLTYNLAIAKSGTVFLDTAYSFATMQESKSLSVIGSTSQYSINGKLTLADGSTLLPGTTVAIYKGVDSIKTVISADGNYAFANVPGGFSYTLKATKSGFTCSTGDIAITNLAGNVIQNFKLSVNKYSISGYVKNSSGTGVSGVAVNLTGSSSATLTTDANGFYKTDSLNATGTYTVTPTKTNATFTPVNNVYAGLSTNVTAPDFIIAEETMLFGYVKDGTTPIANVLVRITPSWIGGGHAWDTYANQSTRTDANGYYEFRNGPTTLATLKVACNNEWDKLSYNFRPLADTTWTNFSGVHQVDWNTTAGVCTISGAIKDSLNNAISGITVKLKSGSTVLATTNTNATGNYTLSIPKNTTCVVEPNLTNYNFTPSTIDLGTVTENVTANFTGTFMGQYYTISGTVSKTDNSVFAGVTINMTGGAIKTATTGSDGTYSFTNVSNGLDYVLKAVYSGSSFAPDSIELTNLSANSSSNNFTEKPKVYYTMSGSVKKSDGTGLNGVTVTLTGNSQTLTTTTNASGNYSFANILAGLNYTLTPSVSGMNFNPGTKTISNLSGNSVNDFVPVESVYIYGYVKNGATPVSGTKVQIVLNWTSATAGYQSLFATTDATGYYQYVLTGDYIGGAGGSVKINAWDNGNTTYYPTDGYTFTTFSKPEKCDFNSQQNAITVSAITSGSVSAAIDSAVPLTADATILMGSVQSVSFQIDSQTIVATYQSGNSWTANWIPSTVDSTFTFVATASGESITGTANGSVRVNCSGVGCPNKKPVISLVTPTTTIEQQASFTAITIGANATDPDGTISGVSFTVDGTSKTTTVSGSTYSCTFTPTEYKKYTITITATDNSAGITAYTKEYTVRAPSVFTPIPDWVVVGYHHTTFSNGTFGSQTLADLVGSKFNSINCSFIETTDGYIPKFEVTTSAQGAGPYNNNNAQLKADINTLKAAGKPVLVSIGGANGHIELSTDAQRNTFVAGIISIVEEYGFDGIDLDFEGGTMAYTFPNNSWTYDEAAYPKLSNIIKAIRAISDHFGPDFIITAAPETQYIQGATSAYTTGWGSFLIVVENIRDILDYIHVQLYNTGSQTAANGASYAQGTPNFVVGMTEMLLNGFNTTSSLHFNGLRPDQVAVGLPSCPAAAPAGGYMTPAKVVEALDYLTKGTKGSDISYTLLGGPYPVLRGVMTWSTNWDANSSFEFSTNYYDYHYGSSVITNANFNLENSRMSVYPNPAKEEVVNVVVNAVGLLSIYSSYGICVGKIKLAKGSNKVNINRYSAGIYIFVGTLDNNNSISKKVEIMR